MIEEHRTPERSLGRTASISARCDPAVEETMPGQLLIDPDDSILIVIDAQPAFLDKLPAPDRRTLVSHLCWLIGVATWLAIPLVVTAEDLPHLGGVAPELAHCSRTPPSSTK